MRFAKRLYWGNDIADPYKVARQLRRRKKWLHVFVIILHEGRDQLDIVENHLLYQKYYKKNPPFVVGFAMEYDEAVNLVVQMAVETYNRQGDCDIKRYLRDRESIC